MKTRPARDKRGQRRGCVRNRTGTKPVCQSCACTTVGAAPASRADWKSRGHLSPFDNAKPKELLGWAPESDRDAFWRRAIDEAHLFW